MTRRPPRRRELTEEERRLWEAAMRGTRTLHAPRKTLAQERSRSSPQPQQSPGADDAKPAARDRPPAKKPAPPPSPRRPQQATAAAPATTPLARRAARRIVRNPETIDARIDLHGMRQREAYPALKGFLRASQARGHRLVLVITGKGSARDLHQPDHGDWEAPPLHEAPRGVLRRLVPEWLAKPEFREVVVSVSPAHPRHGGEGALYICLRRVAPRAGRRAKCSE